VKSVYRSYTDRKRSKEQADKEEELLIPANLFEIPKQTIIFEIPFCSLNEKVSKQFLKKFNTFTNDQYNVNIKLKDKNPYPACKIYEGTYVCGANYVGETIRNVVMRWQKHEIFIKIQSRQNI